MKKKQNSIVNWITLALLVVIATFSQISSASAYGPERATYTMENPAETATFNSITNNPAVGDERNFVRIAEKGNGQAYSDEVQIVPGKEYEVYIYYHNNASSTFNSTEYNRKGVAWDTKLKTQFTSTIKAGERGEVSAIISSSNATPSEVWDEAYMTAAETVTLHYLTGSAKIYNDWDASGSVLPTSLFSEGTYIGMNELNGMIYGCDEFSGYVVYTLVAEKIGASIEKFVSLDGKTFSDSIKANTGNTVEYKIVFNNTGNTNLTNVTIKDLLPNNIELITGSVMYYPYGVEAGEALGDAFVTGNGYDFGTFGPNTNGVITFRARINPDMKLKCGDNFLDNTVSLVYDGGGQGSAQARINVYNQCENSEIPETGPTEIILACIIVLSICGGMFYWYRSQKMFSQIEKSTKGKE